MKEINKRDTSILLATLDRDIDMKCMELKEKQRQIRLKNIFFLSCIFILLSFLMQIFFKLFNVNFIAVIIVYQTLASILFIPFIPNLSKGVVLK
ncbi:hypothetical protein [Clostridium kluyveri]|uniref:Uncharacterized protein n=1 Tax=Clostridium kluyveri TaxID=1534 RepID=A0A1L5F489_CLOKL|nr:hypothetical protein [Clostridium kluyveri]APM37828.1 hypothetical protein BS101_03285 [Clostridium kluyveri]UZQ52172.1 hypothetical protein OP486_08450 [Clostridium kluyveri]